MILKAMTAGLLGNCPLILTGLTDEPSARRLTPR